MDLVHGTGKKHRNTGGISSIFAEAMRQIGGVYGGRAINQRFLSHYNRKPVFVTIKMRQIESSICLSGAINQRFPNSIDIKS
jgi:hypothetical protein